MVFTMLLWSQVEEPTDPLKDIWYELARYACLLFTIPVILLLGGPLLVDAAGDVRRGRASMNLLLCAGMAAALAYSIWSVWTGEGHVYFEVPCTVLVAVTLGRWLEATGKLKTTAALRGLKQLLPDKVRLLRDCQEHLVDTTQLVAGDEFRALPGERIAADGEIVRNEAAVDEQAVTGESLPVARRPGDRVMSGTLVLDGPLDIRASAPAGEGTLARMIEAVSRATAARTQYERLAERISRWFLPVIALVAFSSFAGHALLGDSAAGMLAGLAVVVIACPCALGLATPMALWAAVGRAAASGVLLRDGDALTLLARAKTVCFDKTGTLTTGDASVDELYVDVPSHEGLCLSMAGALSRASNHPLAGAVTRYADARIQSSHVSTVERTTVRAGRGITGRIANLQSPAFLGSRAWLTECGQTIPTCLLAAAGDPHDTAAETLVAWDGVARGRFIFHEQLRPEAERTLTTLRSIGLTCVMVTGDRQPRARALAESLKIDYRAELLPEAKLAMIRELQATKGPVLMIGDGINDAPALAAADVGISLGVGTDISRQSACVCLLTNDLTRLPWLIALARQTEQTIRWNLFWAFAYNAVGIGVAAAGYLHPVIAAMAMALSSVLVISNSLSLGRFELDGDARGASHD
jgi:heavy metal translocating P-type ATPase